MCIFFNRQALYLKQTHLASCDVNNQGAHAHAEQTPAPQKAVTEAGHHLHSAAKAVWMQGWHDTFNHQYQPQCHPQGIPHTAISYVGLRL